MKNEFDDMVFKREKVREKLTSDIESIAFEIGNDALYDKKEWEKMLIQAGMNPEEAANIAIKIVSQNEKYRDDVEYQMDTILYCIIMIISNVTIAEEILEKLQKFLSSRQKNFLELNLNIKMKYME